jgi:hypothetical protein
MSPSPQDHVRYRELMAARLDALSTLPEEAELVEHLARCGRCRATERAYRTQRQQLRSSASRPITPPRDLWARTSAALDREVARQGGYRRHGRARRQVLAGGAAVASVTALGLSIGLVATQLLPSAAPRVTPPAAQLDVRPTPFTVPSEALAFLGATADGLAVYRTSVDRVCPAAAIDCADFQASAPAIVSLPRTLQPSNLALSPNGGRLAIQGRAVGGEDVIAVVVMPDEELPRSPGRSDASPEATPRHADSPLPAASVPTESPAAPPTTPTPMVKGPTASATPMGGATSAPTATPAATAAAPSLPADDAPASLLPTETMLAILDEVRSVGAPAAWSPDGSALAFSAMPADLSRGPNVYLWRPGDDRAQPLTDDDSSYFASWAGSRVVASRVSPTDPAAVGDEPSVTTVVIDPRTGEQRVAATGRGLWLPAVSPLGTKLVAWQGSLRWDGNEVEPLAGGLYVADWTELDPYLERFRETPEPTDLEETPARPDETTDPDADADADEAPTASDEEASENEESAPADRSPANDEAPEQDEAEPGAEDQPNHDVALVPVEPGRDPAIEPVRDWQIRWSGDGGALAYWIADVPGASWGQLTVIGVDLASGELAYDEPMLAAGLARRAFSLGDNRVAWVAPADDEPQGELRVRTWGDGGFGDMRLRPPPIREVVPAS